MWAAVSALIAVVVLGAAGSDRASAAAVESNEQGLSKAQVSGGINHTVPKVSPPSRELSFSAAPGDAEFLRTGLFVEPLAPVSGTVAQENRDLAHALLAYRDAVHKTGANDAVEPILAFLDKHPDSAWKPALQLDLGIVYRQTGHFSKALEIWQTGWQETQGLRDPEGRALANAIVARLSQLDAYLGRKEVLQPLLDSIHDRPVGGAVSQLITDSHTGLYDMLHKPETSFLCGPLALKRILNYSSSAPSPVSLQVLEDAHSTPNGLSLSAVRGFAAKAGMNYQMAFRTPGAAVVTPAVAHWKVGHYAAIVDRVAGRYLIQDTTFGEDIRMSRATLDEEGSGYFLVPAGPLPKGWRSVSADEGSKVWGRGDTGKNRDPSPPPPPKPPKHCKPPAGGCTTATVEPETVSLVLQDEPVGYQPPVGPAVEFDFDYFQREVLQPTTFPYTNFGPNWTFSWISYVTVSSNVQASVFLRGGGSEPFTFSSASAMTAYPGPYSQATLTRTVNGSGAATGFTLTFPDGTFQEYNQPLGSGGQFFMTAVGDAAGNTVILTYDSQMRIVAITDAIGQVSTLTYGVSGSPLLVTQITDPFGRSASFTYNSSGQLASITDVLGITSSYTYGQGTEPDFVNTLTTPYGSTTFTFGDSSTNSSLGSTVFLKTVDPLGRTSYVEYDQGVDAGDTSNGAMKNPALIPTGMVTCNQYLYYRNTFVFDANQFAQASQGGGSLNYALAKVIHWAHTSDFTNASRVKESEKEPLENRVWYNYPGQGTASCASITFPVNSAGTVGYNGSVYTTNQPSVIGRVLDNGATQLETFQYNPQGNITVVTDPIGRQVTYTYAANGIDRLTTTNTTSTPAQLLETRTYNSLHEPLTITGANGRTARYQYNAAGQMTRYTDPLGHATAYTYDSSGHLKTIQGPIAGAGYSLSYDSVGRTSATTDPAGATIHYAYDAADRPTSTTYPDGTNSLLTYNLLDLASSTDRLGQTTSYSYDADRELVKTTDALGHTLQQGYNSAGFLTSVTDSNGHTTMVTRDAQSRVIARRYADGTSQSITYESSVSLPATLTDALGQVTAFGYNSDNTKATISYIANQTTPSVSFSYDPAFPRPTSMTDGVGTTTYSYYPVSLSPALGAGLVRSISSPIAGASGSDTVTYTYDALNRVTGRTVNGASQSIGFDALGRVISVSNPLDTFTYGYSDATARVAAISSSQGPAISLSYFGPQGDEELQQLTATTQGGVALSQFGYTYNADYNVTSFTQSSPAVPTTSASYTYDTVNRLQSVFVGAATTPTFAYGYDPASNPTSITANGSQQSPSYTVTNALTSGTYDANGSPTVLAGNTYTWDGANRIVSFSGTANNASSFTYDGLGRVVRIVDTNNGSVVADHSYLWCGPARCLAHDNTQSGSPVSTQYWDQGVIANGTPYYYVEDQLGSVRQLVTTSGTVAVQYDYDPYGNPTTVTGTATSDIGYAGYFHHPASGMEFALFRAYDPARARWLNRDPIAEAGGVNLYAYAEENPVGAADPSGFCVCQGRARVLQGNAKKIGDPGGFDTDPPNPKLYDVTADSAAVIPSQFGMTKPGMRPYVNQISGTLGNGESFNDVRDVVDNYSTRKENGWSVAQFQQHVIDREEAKDPGEDLLILELPGIPKDPGIQDVTLNLPDNFTCPHGTK
jgi:RHS repeat-associated protein